MSADKTGGPAFPMREEQRKLVAENMELVTPGEWPGMTLRDYFAIHENSFPPLSWWQSRVGSHVESERELHGVEWTNGMSAWRYQCADAMIAERAK